MSLIIPQTTPRLWSWSKNPMTISFFQLGPTSARLRFEVYIADRFAPEGWTMVYSGSQTFTNRLTTLELQRILDSELTFYHNHLLTNDSVYTDDIIPGVIYDRQTCRYKVKYGLSSEAYSSWDETAELWCIKGGVSVEGYQKNQDILNDGATVPIMLHQGLYMQYTEAPVQISFLYRGAPTYIRVYTLDASMTAIDTYIFYIDSTIAYGSVVHLSMKLDLTGVSFVKFTFIKLVHIGMFWVPVEVDWACPAVMPPVSSYRMYSYVNSLGGTDTLVMQWNRLETLNYEEQVTERAAPITADNAFNPMIPSEMRSDRRERMVMNGDVSQMMQFYGSKFYDRVFNQLRQLCISPDIKEFEWGYYETGNVNVDSPALGTTTWSLYYLRYVPVTVTNTNSQSIVKGNADNMPDPFPIELTRSASDSQYMLQQRRSCIDRDYAIMEGGERYARLTFMIESNHFNYTLVSADTFAPRVGVDAGDGSYVWNISSLSWSAVMPRVIHVDFYYQPQIPAYTIPINMSGQAILYVSGQVPPGTTSFSADNGWLLIFDAILPAGLLTLDLSYNYVVQMPILIAGLTSVNVSGNYITGLTAKQIAGIVLSYKSGAGNVNMSTNALKAADMDSLLVALDTSGYTGGVLDLRTQNLSIVPTAIGTTAAANMTGTKGWTIHI